MIALLKGLVASIEEDGAIIDVNGVGYRVFASRRTLSRLTPDAAAELRVETHVREDHIHLYGFIDAEEKHWFGLLTTVQGVGARVALAILSVLEPSAVARAIAVQDTVALCRAAGVGRKLAARIAGELKDKAGAMAFARPEGARMASGATAAAAEASPFSGVLAATVSALENLGYARAEAAAAAARAAAAAGDGAPEGEVIRLALKDLAQ